jgi:hypothetical protein
MQAQLAKASVAEKKQIQQDINEFTKDQLKPAKAKLAKDTQTLEVCRAGSTAAAHGFQPTPDTATR